MQVKIQESWRTQLQEEFDKPYFARLAAFVREEYRTQRVCPVNRDLFRVFNLCPFDRVRVVILGQDPYPDPRFYYGIWFLGARRRAHPRVAAEHLPRGARRHGTPRPRLGTTRTVGRAGRAVDEHDLHHTRLPKRIAPRPRLGGVLRRRHPAPQRAARPSGLPALGAAAQQKAALIDPTVI